jgi:hypothetical protein
LSRNGQKRSHNAEMAEAAKGTLGARRRSNSRLAALIEAEKVDELDDRAARAPEPDSAAVVDFKKKLQEQREAADAAARAPTRLSRMTKLSSTRLLDSNTLPVSTSRTFRSGRSHRRW